MWRGLHIFRIRNPLFCPLFVWGRRGECSGFVFETVSVYVCLLFRCVRTGGNMWRNASREDVLMMGDFLDDFTLAMAWVPTGSPEEAFDLVYREYVGFAHDDFPFYLVCVQIRGGVSRMVRLQRAILCHLLRMREVAMRRCYELIFDITGEASI